MSETDIVACVSLQRAAEILGDGEPLSRAKIHRLIKQNHLEKRGRNHQARITVRSLNTYRASQEKSRAEHSTDPKQTNDQ